MTKIVVNKNGFIVAIIDVDKYNNPVEWEVREDEFVVDLHETRFAKPKYNFETQQWEEGATGKVLDDFNKLQEQCKQEETQFKIQQNLPYELLRALNDLQLKTLKLERGSK